MSPGSLNLILGGVLALLGVVVSAALQAWRDQGAGRAELEARRFEAQEEHRQLYLVNPIAEFVCSLLGFADELEELASGEISRRRSSEEILATRQLLLRQRSITMARAAALGDDQLRVLVTRFWHRWLVFLGHLEAQEFPSLHRQRQELSEIAGEILGRLGYVPSG